MSVEIVRRKLESYAAIRAEARQLRDRLEEIEARVYYPAIPRLTGMPGGGAGGAGSKQERASDSTEALRSRYRAMIDELDRQALEIEEMIAALDTMERNALRMLYIYGLGWAEVAAGIGYSERHAHRIVDRAIEALAEKYLPEE